MREIRPALSIITTNISEQNLPGKVKKRNCQKKSSMMFTRAPKTEGLVKVKSKMAENYIPDRRNLCPRQTSGKIKLGKLDYYQAK